VSERVVLVGAGGFGRCWTAALRGRAEDVKVVAVVEPDAAEREAAAERFGLTRTQLFAAFDDEVAALGGTMMIDSSPFPYRVMNATRAFAAGLDVLAAKPLGGSLADARAIVEAARTERRQLAVAQQMRYFPCFVAMRAILASGDYGSVRAVEIRMALDGRGWRPGTAWRLAMTDPLLVEAGIHHFDLIRWCLDTEVEDVAAAAWNPPWSPFRDNATVAALLRTRHGVPVSYRATFAPRPGQEPIRFDSGWRVTCDKALITVHDGGVYVDGIETTTKSTPEPVSLDVLNREMFDVWLDARADGCSPPFSGEDNLASMTILDRALRSAARRAAR
jgi:predicted dehydrogenase